MRFFPISLLLFLIFTSCSLKTTEGLRAIPVLKKEVINPYFSNSSTDYIYKAKINIYGRYFGGILIIKKIDEDSHRVVFTTEFGSKIFDFQYEGNTFTKNFMLENIDRKQIVNTLQKDFHLLISEKAQVMEQYASEEKDVYKTQPDKGFNFYFFDSKMNTLDRIVNTSKRKEKISFVFASEEKNVAQKIVIKHTNIKLTIDLEIFKKD